MRSTNRIAKLSLWGCALLLLCVGLSSAGWDHSVASPAREAQAAPDAKLSARERWEALPADKRARLQQRFERLKGMELEERESLSERASMLRKVEQRVLSGLSEPDRARLMAQKPERRAQLLRELVESELRSRGQRIEAKLPEQVRERLEQASPKERRAKLEQFKRETRERTSGAAVQQIAEALGFGSEEIARLQRLPVEERMDKVLELQARLSKEQVAAMGLPKGLSAERWKELDALTPREYFSQIMALRADGVLAGPASEAGGAPELQQVGADLSRQLDQDPRERLELSALDPGERRAELDRRRRQRAMRVVREHDVLTPQQLEILEGLSDREFFRQSRRLSQELQRGTAPRLGRQPGRREGERAREPKASGAGGARREGRGQGQRRDG